MIRLDSITISGQKIDFDPPLILHESDDGVLIKHNGSIVWSQTHNEICRLLVSEEGAIT